MASLMLQWLFDGKDMNILLTVPVGPNPTSDLKVASLEIIFTFMYAFTSCGSRSDPRANKEMGGLAVGASIFFAAIITGKITGTSLNPARTLGPAIVIGNFKKNKEMGGLAVGASIFFAAIITGKITGTSLNPARTLGPAIVIGNFKKVNQLYMKLINAELVVQANRVTGLRSLPPVEAFFVSVQKFHV
ncbi:Aquaporin NIP1-1 [Apostasia shenzhenica]|uniref:Aquaporin NIP1-1 n=1 Tax=Apostasia shenzhenica TaxID=1088818 RepID=A0A2I0AC61_9ASPA|nr:Aquaporin NIP1-1 [Apostasia shenzhenica]